MPTPSRAAEKNDGEEHKDEEGERRAVGPGTPPPRAGRKEKEHRRPDKKEDTARTLAATARFGRRVVKWREISEQPDEVALGLR